MNAKEWFKKFGDEELLGWWRQYGASAAAAAWEYRDAPRRACAAEMRRRGLDLRTRRPHTPRPKGYGDPHKVYRVFWGMPGQPREMDPRRLP